MLTNQERRSITILGIDPGLRHTGYGIIEKIENKLFPIAFGVINSGEGALSDRLAKIFGDVRKVVQDYQPDLCAIEIVFVNINPKSSLALGQARGAAICALSESNKKITEITALQIKQRVTGHGRATKKQIKKMVSRFLRFDVNTNGSKKLTNDSADALACAIACAMQLPIDYQFENYPKQNNNPLSIFKQQHRRRIATRWKSVDIQ